MSDLWGYGWRMGPEPTARLAMPQGGWYHASPHELPVGTVLTPGGGPTQYDRFYDRTDQDRSGHVWVDTLRNVKRRWADPDHFIYQVEPHADPQLFQRQVGRGMSVGGEDGYTVPGATITKVVRGHTAARLGGANGDLPENLHFREHQGWTHAYDGEHLIGYLRPAQGKIDMIKVAPEYRRQGIGTAMLDWHRNNVDPDLGHSTDQTPLGRAWGRSVGWNPPVWNRQDPDIDTLEDYEVERGPHTAARLAMPIYYHVTPRRNVDSIRQHGLDYTKGEAMWHHDGATPGNYFWDHPGHADQYANELDERDQQEYGSMNWDEENDGHVVLPFNHDALALPDPENEWNDEMEGRSFYSPDPIPASAFHHTASRLAAFPDGLHIQPEDDDWVAYHQGTPVGSLSVDYSTEVPSIDSIRVHPDYRRHGIGKALWEAAGRPAHTPDDMSADGQAWARAVGGPRLAMPAPLQFPIEHLEPHNLYDPVAATDSDHYPDLVRHIREHGVQMPITLETDGELGLVADGNHRLAAAREAGLTHLPVRFLRESTRNLERWGGTPLHPAIQQHLADNPASIASTYDRQPSWAQGDYITSSRLAMPAYYHHTDDPDFHPDPERQPTSMSQHPGGPGIFLTPEERPDMWKGLHGGDDYRVEFHADDDITGHPGVWSENYGLDGAPLEIFVPGDQMHHLTVKNVHPRKAKYMTAAVTVYTKPNCPQCTMTKKQLDRLGIEHRDIDVTVDPDAHAYVTGLGYTAAPVVVIGDGENHWAGFKPDRLKGLLS